MVITLPCVEHGPVKLSPADSLIVRWMLRRWSCRPASGDHTNTSIIERKKNHQLVSPRIN